MTHLRQGAVGVAEAEALIAELLRTAIWLFDISASLLDDIPDDAFPEEDSAAVLVEMLAGSCQPSIEAAGEAACRATVEMLVAIRENVRRDLRRAAQLANDKQVLL